MWRYAAAIALSVSALAGQVPAGQTIAAPPAISAQAAREPAAQRAGTGILRGRVVADAPGATPLIKARVSIGGAGTDPVFTDGSGHFEFRNLPAGRFTLTAEKTGYARTRYGATRELDPALPLDLPDAAVLEDIEIRMVKGSAIADRKSVV